MLQNKADWLHEGLMQVLTMVCPEGQLTWGCNMTIEARYYSVYSSLQSSSIFISINQYLQRQRMSDYQSDEETIQKCGSTESLQYEPSPEYMKDLALHKASDIIELLTQELEIQRKAYKQALLQFEAAKQKQEAQISHLKQQNEQLETQLRKRFDSSQGKRKQLSSIRARTSLSRSSSTRSVHKKKSQIIKRQPTEANASPEATFEVNWLRDEYLEVIDWHQTAFVELVELCQAEFRQLSELMVYLQNSQADLDFEFRPRQIRISENSSQMLDIIRQQQRHIIELNSYLSELEDVINCGLAKVCPESDSYRQHSEAAMDSSRVSEKVGEVQARTLRMGQGFKSKLERVENENSELKHIVQELIKFIKIQKEPNSITL